MRHIRGLKVLGLCFVAALAFAAFSAASAQAAEWLYEGSKAITGTEKVPIELVTDKMGTLVTTTGATNTPVEILCSNQSVSGNLEAGGKGSGTLSFFEECKTFLNHVESKVCAPTEPINTNSITAELFEMGTEFYTLFRPTTGTVFAKIKFPNKECVLNAEREVSGTAVIKDCEPEGGGKQLEKHLIEEASEGLFASGEHKDALTFGTTSSQKAAHITGSIWVRLASPNAGKTFGAMK